MAEHPEANPTTPGAVSDNYPTYVLDTFGYHYDAQEWLSDQERAFRVDLLTHHTTSSLTPLLEDTSSLSPLAMLDLAHRLISLNLKMNLSATLTLLEKILAHRPYHGAVYYEEIAEQGMLLSISHHNLEKAQAFYEAGLALRENNTPLWTEADFYKGILSWCTDNKNDARQIWESYISPQGTCDLERCYEVIEWLHQDAPQGTQKEELIDHLTATLKAEARAQGARAILVDLALLLQDEEEE